MTTVTWTATDDDSNSDTAAQLVTVVDTTSPQITVPPDITAECASPAGTSVELGLPTVADICDTDPYVVNNAPTLFPLGSTPVTWTATDSSGNPDSATQTVVIEDTTPPELIVTLTPDRLWPPNHKLVTVRATITATDVCDAVPAVTLVSITSNEPDNGLGDGDAPNDIQGAEFGTDDREFQLRAERSGLGSGRIYTVIYRVTDASGNQTESQVTVTVPKAKSG